MQSDRLNRRPSKSEGPTSALGRTAGPMVQLSWIGAPGIGWVGGGGGGKLEDSEGTVREVVAPAGKKKLLVEPRRTAKCDAY